MSAFLFVLLALASSNPGYKLFSSWTDSRLAGAHGICVDRDGNIVVIDSRNSRVCRYTPEGKFVDEIGAGRFKAPRDARISPDGRIFVSDAGNHYIQVFGHDGKYEQAFGDFKRAHAIAFDDTGRLFVCDVDESRVTVFGPQLRQLRTWRGKFNAPHGAGVDPEGNVVISNYNGPVQKYTPEGKLLLEFAPIGKDGEFMNYHSMCTDREGHIYVTARDHQENGYVLKFDGKGNLLARMAMPEKRQLIQCVAVDGKGRVFATYSRNGTGVHVFAPE